MRWPFALILCFACVCGAQQSPQTQASDSHLGSFDPVAVPTTDGIVFDAMINGKGPFQLILDTNASVNLLNPAVIAQLGLPSDSDTLTIPAIGGAVESKPFHVDELRIGGLSVHGPTFFSIQMPWPDGTGPVGAIGYQIISQLVVTVDYEHQHLTFFDSASFRYHGRGEKISLKQDPPQIVVNASIDGKFPGDFVVDTGDLGGLDVNQSFVEKFALLDHVPHRYHGVFGGGAGGDSPPGWIARIKTVCIEKSCVHGVITFLSDGQDSFDNHAGIIGRDVLKQFTVTVDWPHRALYLERNAARAKPEVFNRSGILGDLDDRGKALKVFSVLPDSPGDKAGVKAGDRIIQIDHKPPLALWDKDEPAFLQRAGTIVSLTIQRGSVIQEVKIRLKKLL